MATYFEWNPAKAAANVKKHGVNFELAKRVFSDPFARSSQDRIEGNEYRWRTIGLVEGIALVAAHTVREENESQVIRIISARRAEPRERRRYEQAEH